MTPLPGKIYCMILAKPINSTELYYIKGADKYNEDRWQKHIASAIEQRTKAIEYEHNRVPVYSPGVSFPTALQLKGWP